MKEKLQSLNEKEGHYSCFTITDEQALKSNFYPKDSKKQLAITRKLVVFVGATNAPISVVDGPEFHNLLTEKNGQYMIPGRKK